MTLGTNPRSLRTKYTLPMSIESDDMHAGRGSSYLAHIKDDPEAPGSARGLPPWMPTSTRGRGSPQLAQKISAPLHMNTTIK